MPVFKEGDDWVTTYMRNAETKEHYRGPVKHLAWRALWNLEIQSSSGNASEATEQAYIAAMEEVAGV